MQKSLQAYLALLTLANALFGWGGICVCRLLRSAYLDLLKPDDLPLWTVRALRLSPGFFALASLALVLGVVAWRRGASAPCIHAAVGIVAADLGLLVYALLGLVLPFLTLTVKL